MNCFKWDSACVAPSNESKPCDTATWFWILAAAGIVYVMTKKG